MKGYALQNWAEALAYPGMSGSILLRIEIVEWVRLYLVSKGAPDSRLEAGTGVYSLVGLAESRIQIQKEDRGIHRADKRFWQQVELELKIRSGTLIEPLDPVHVTRKLAWRLRRKLDPRVGSRRNEDLHKAEI